MNKMLVSHRKIVLYFSESDKTDLQSTLRETIEALNIKKTALSQKNFVMHTGKNIKFIQEKNYNLLFQILRYSRMK